MQVLFFLPPMLRRVLLAAGLLAVFGVLGVAANTRSVRVSNGVNEAVVSGATGPRCASDCL